MPEIDPFIQYPDLGPLDPLAPMGIAADRSTTSDALATQPFNEGREVKAPQSESNCNYNAFPYQAFNAISADQYHTAPQTMSHTSVYPSENTTVPLHYPGVNINDGATVTWDMTTASDATASQVDRQGIHTAEGYNGNEEKEERYVVWDGSGSL